MNRLAFSWLMAAFSVVLLTACGGKKVETPAEPEENWEEQALQTLRDSTIYGLCTDGSAMNTLQMVTDSGDTLTLSTIDAQEAGMVFGGYKVGDRMAVLADKKAGRVTMIINESSLLGDWVMPNPMDGSSEMGISIKDGGIAESINQSAIIYKTWRLINGRLEITSVRDGGGDFEETETFQILFLSNDSLSYKDSETTFEMTHPTKDVENMLLHGADDEDDFSDLMM